ncbi:MAG: patatin-like phospholipase family protein [Candidatus Cloacimonetes bacterium]|nr:patatin-like phospholipase family protein [Candidatus Cloacimonadota bacterium]MCF7814026.1 patatin-like phospholipase family protein [Candidatus Cloacimonadota bacterium]MCF7868070.1 patatin-like phospholipase family protein [Candidatus Cloacimonadota bacterium]MCF7883493.1 patatin-like phospholipase family protein [Candidatus Cloacimonadota bacterium]
MKKTFLIIILLICVNIFAQTERLKIGLVLSGGGARGIAHVGVLKVLQEAGLEFDYITGTSMGSIVGGLHAIGYSADELEDLLNGIDWDEILLDKIARSSISLEEKGDREKYVGSFPIQNRKITLPVGVVSGQQVQALLTKLCLSVHHIEDFDNLPIPFRCIATDVEFGKVVVLKSGFLPDAIRASMSIPSLFAPIEIEGQLLVDGGIFENFPVQDCQDMGADIIVGVDVGTPLYSKKELNSLVRIMNQAIAFQGVESVQEARNLCDILIEPEVDDYSIMDFDQAEKLMELGEEAGRKMVPEIQALVDSLKAFPSKEKIIPIKEVDRLHIKQVHIQGLRNVSRNLVYGKLQINDDSWISTKKLQTSIERVYGSQYFEKVTYKLVPRENGVDLFVRCVEKIQDNFNFAFHYDRNTKTSVLLNTTFRNKLILGSKLSLNLILGENFGQDVAYFIHTGWKPGFGFGAQILARDYEIKVYEDGEKIALYDYNFVTNRFDLQTIVSNSSSIGGAVEYKDTELKPVIANPGLLDYEYRNFIYKGYFLIDTYDSIIFPTKGVRFYTEVERTIQLSNNIDLDYNPITTFNFLFAITDRFTDKLFYEEKLRLGNIDGEQMPVENEFQLGGYKTPLDITVPFIGYDFLSLSTKSYIVLYSTFRYEIFNGIYGKILGNWGLIGTDNENLLGKRDYISGYGISLAIDTPFGPIEGIAMQNGENKKENIFTITIGYDFLK